MTTSNWDKFVLLLWKNWIIQKRHYVQTAFEVTIPVLACSLLILVRGLVTPTIYTEPTTFTSLNVRSLASIREMVTNHPISLTIAYAPRNDVLERIVGRAARMLGTDVLHQGFNDSESMYNVLVTHNYLAGLEFGDELANITSLPEQVRLAVRFPSEMRTATLPGAQFWANWCTFLIFPQYQVYGARNINGSDGGYPANYFTEGFASVQNAISRAVLEARAGRSDVLPHVELRRFPYPPFYDDPLLRGLENLFPSIIMVAFFYSCINTVKFITLEKEKQLKESMKVMGLDGWIHWMAWFVRTLTLLTVSITLVTVLLSCNLTTNTKVAVFEFSDRFLIWLFLFVYSITTIMLCFLVSTFFSKANIASGIAGIVWFYSLTPFQLTIGNYYRMPLAAKLVSSLWSNTAMGYGVTLFMKHEGTSIGLQWDNFLSPVTVDDQLTMGHIFFMLFADAVLYLALALYIEQIAPGQFGVPRKWNFIFTGSFWKQEVFRRNAAAAESEVNAPPGSASETERLQSTGRYQANRDEEPADAQVGISMVGLTKIYHGGKSSSRAAVKELTVNFYRDQITVLLGHNGAGKTTTMGMLTGMYPPTAGYATIEGHRIGGTAVKKFRNTLGFCPQHNVLFDELTVAEHIRFFARLKGIRQEEYIETEIDKYVRALQLEPKRNEQSHTLSGGMKRKLSLAIALCGGSRVVFCDEPTSGMDPGARRTVWDLLQQEKRDRTIVLSTHFMDEADVLGDRIAVMCDGELRAVGTPFFLKKRFGAGYRLVCVKRPDCQPETVVKLLRRYVPDVAIESDIGTELSLRLREQHRAMFQPALEELEQKIDQCGISGYGIALSTLEEVFMRLGSDEAGTSEQLRHATNGVNASDKKHLTNGTHTAAAPPSITITETYELQTGARLLCSQINAMLSKKYLSFVRSWKISILQILLPMMFVLLVIGIVQYFPSNVVLPPLEISLASYERTRTVLSTTDRNAPVVPAYEHTIKNSPGRGQHSITVTERNFTDYMLEKSTENIRAVDNTYMIGASFDVAGRNFTAWFNNKAYHTAPLSLSVLYNALTRTVCPNCSLTVTNKPLPYSSHVRFLRTEAGSNLGFQLAFNTGFAMAFVGALYVMYYVRERASGSKLLQFVSGVNAITFWCVSFVWDFAVYCVAMAIYIGALAAFGEEGWSTPEELGRVVIVCVCFGLAIIPFTYLGAYCFDVPSTGFIKMLIFNIFTGTVMFTAVFLLKIKDFDLVHVAETMEWFYMAFPLFALSHSINNINLMETTRQICDAYCDATPFCTPKLACKFNKRCCDVEIFSFSPQGINRNLTYMLCVSVLSFAVLLLKELHVFDELSLSTRVTEWWWRWCSNRHRRPTTTDTLPEEAQSIAIGEDSDVSEERTRVDRLYEERAHQSPTGQAMLMLRDLTKRYGGFVKPPAVDRLTFAVGERECFGLLGVNGAGKTSTFRMLTGDRRITGGDAWVVGCSLRTQLPAVYRRIGYCPQFDALLEDLTGRETLRIFARLRGIPSGSIAPITERLAVELNFALHLDKLVQAYSGGTRRKLSTALALLGDPVVVYLDEPTTGMDPGSKRHFWNVMCRVRAEGRTALVLTSHSMEECEALCTRLAIMVNGEFRCLGSAQHLKNKFSHGYFLTVKLKRTGDGSPTEAERNKRAIKTFMQETFSVSSGAAGGAILKEEYNNYLTYHIRDTGHRWSDMFGLLERARDKLRIEDYALGQTSLEQVFLQLTANQRTCNEA
ncbi:ATP-binding cassette sub-family A member 3-like [Anopheles stephensi]|uniref:ATP-binding cassette sub-family A member 3-like n=1 Tax=Anopheles stephensi TaxID=30069 RepID=UPI001658B32B|nr:ATP-binding cassette sub-family A member 3-like [Anopheles stephensi]